MVTLAVFALLQLTFFATNAVSVDINPRESSNAVSFWTAIAAIAAFFLGGLVASATTPWGPHGRRTLQGTLLWALAVVSLVLLSVFGATFLATALGSLSDRPDVIQERLTDLNATGGGSEPGRRRRRTGHGGIGRSGPRHHHRRQCHRRHRGHQDVASPATDRGHRALTEVAAGAALGSHPSRAAEGRLGSVCSDEFPGR
jgi:hypothetical protein